MCITGHVVSAAKKSVFAFPVILYLIILHGTIRFRTRDFRIVPLKMFRNKKCGNKNWLIKIATANLYFFVFFLTVFFFKRKVGTTPRFRAFRPVIHTLARTLSSLLLYDFERASVCITRHVVSAAKKSVFSFPVILYLIILHGTIRFRTRDF